MAISKRQRRVIENLPDEMLFKNLRALMAFRGQNEGSLYKVDLALAIIKHHRFIDVTDLCKEISSTENLFELMQEYLGTQFRLYGLDLKELYRNGLLMDTCPFFHEQTFCPISKSKSSEAAAIQRAIQFLKLSDYYIAHFMDGRKTIFEIDKIPALGDIISSERPLRETFCLGLWRNFMNNIEEGKQTWLDKVYEALEYCLFNKIFLNDDNDEGESSLLDLETSDKRVKDTGIIDNTLQYSSLDDAFSTHDSPLNIELTNKTENRKTKITDAKIKEVKIRLLSKYAKLDRIAKYLENRCNFQKKNLQRWGIKAKLLSDLVKDHLNDSETILSDSAPLPPPYGRPLTTEEKKSDPLYQARPYDKPTSLHFIISTGMWSDDVEYFMELAGHNLTSAQGTDLVVMQLLREYEPHSSRDALKKINTAYYELFSEALKKVQTAQDRKIWQGYFNSTRFTLKWNEYYDKKNEFSIMQKIIDGRF